MKRTNIVILLGGGPLLLTYADYLKDELSVEAIVLTSKRHLEDSTGGGTFRDALTSRKLTWKELPSLTPAALQALNVDLGAAVVLSFAAPWIIKEDVLQLMGRRVYNLHGARLPQDRGGASKSWQIMRGNAYGYALLHQVDSGIDTGDIVDYHEFLYEGCRTPLEYQQRSDVETIALLKRVTPALLRGEEPRRLAQPPYLSTYWPRLNTELHGWIDWSWSGLDVLRFVSAFDDPYPGAHTLLDDRPVYLKGCAFDSSDGVFHPFQSGLIYRISAEYAAVCVTTGSLIVRRFLDSDGQEVPLGSLTAGDRLYTPPEKLEEARRGRVRYTASGLAE